MGAGRGTRRRTQGVVASQAVTENFHAWRLFVKSQGLSEHTLRSYYLGDESEGPMFDYEGGRKIVAELFQDFITTGALTLSKGGIGDYEFNLFSPGTSNSSVSMVRKDTSEEDTIIIGVFNWFAHNPLMASETTELILGHLRGAVILLS